MTIHVNTARSRRPVTAGLCCWLALPRVGATRLPEPVRALKGARSLPERVSHTPWDTGLSGSGQSSSVEGGALGDPVTGVRVVGELNEHACVLSGFSRV